MESIESNIASRYLNDIRKQLEKLSELNIDESRDLLSKIDIIESEANKIVDVVVLGNYNSWKTSLLNAIIAIVTNNFEPLLPSSKSENTFYITIIENSNDDYFHVETYKNEKIEFVQKFVTHTGLSDFLNEFDKDSFKYLNTINEIKNVKEEKLKKHKSIVDENYNPDIQVKIKIPNFWKNIRLVDTPGLTSRFFRERLYNVLAHSLFPIFVFVRSLVQEQVIEKVNTSILTYLKDHFKKGVVILFLSKKDLLIKELKGTHYFKINQNEKKSTKIEKLRNVENYTENLQNFCRKIFEIEKWGFNFSKIVMSNSHGVIDEDEICKAEMQNFVKYLEDLPITKGEKLKLSCFKLKINNLIDELNNKLETKTFFDENEIQKIMEIGKDSIREFQDSVNNWMSSIEKLEDFLDKYQEILKSVHQRFIEVDQTVLERKNYMIRSTYIRDQLDELSEDFDRMIKDDILYLNNNSIENFWLKLPVGIREKCEQYFYDKGLIANKINWFTITIGLIISIALTVGARFAFGVILEGLAITAGISFIPIVGWITGGLIGASTLIISISNYTGMWKRLNCWDDLAICYHNNLMNAREKITETIIKQYEEIINTLLDKLSNLKVIFSEIQNIYSINKIYELENEPNLSCEVLLREVINTINDNNKNAALKGFIDEVIKRGFYGI